MGCCRVCECLMLQPTVCSRCAGGAQQQQLRRVGWLLGYISRLLLAAGACGLLSLQLLCSCLLLCPARPAKGVLVLRAAARGIGGEGLACVKTVCRVKCVLFIGCQSVLVVFVGGPASVLSWRLGSCSVGGCGGVSQHCTAQHTPTCCTRVGHVRDSGRLRRWVLF